MPDGTSHPTPTLPTATALTILCGVFDLQVPIDIIANLLLNLIDTVTPCNPVAVGIASAWREHLFGPRVAPSPLAALHKLGVNVLEVSPDDEMEPIGMQPNALAFWHDETTLILRSINDRDLQLCELTTAIGARILTLSGIDIDTIRSGKHEPECNAVGRHFVVPREIVEEAIGEVGEFVTGEQTDAIVVDICQRTHANAASVCRCVIEALEKRFGHPHYDHRPLTLREPATTLSVN